MKRPKPDPLDAALASLAEKIRAFGRRRLGEQDTKASLIEPLLEALEWDVRHPDEVRREYRPSPRDCPVDYGLMVQGRPAVLVEAKPLGADLSERRWVSQALNYALMAGVDWCVLCDGDLYSLYNITASTTADGKLFWTARVSGTHEERRCLRYLARPMVVSGELKNQWRAHWCERRVCGALRELVDRPPPALLGALVAACGELAGDQIARALRRISATFEPAPLVPAEPAPAPRSKRLTGGVLGRLCRDGLLRPPVRLAATYKGAELTATIQADHTIEVGAVRYRSPSAAARAAVHLAGSTGRKAVNGLSFWRVANGDHRGRTLEELGSLR